MLKRTYVRNFIGLGAVTLFLGLMFCNGQHVQAQNNFLNFGRSPSLSPYLALDNRRIGPLDSYNTFVRPRIESQSIMDQQQMQLNRQAMAQKSTQQILLRGGGGSSAMPAQSGRVNPAATFRNYSHYYQK